MTQPNSPLDRLRYHVTGAIERGEKEPIVAQEAPIEVARARFLRLVIPGLQAGGFTELAARYGVELARLEAKFPMAAAESDHCPDCEFDHSGPCEATGRPAVARGQIE